MPNEPNITINGVKLTQGQAMTMRVALESYALEMQTTGLGEHEHGRRMSQAYLARIREIRALYMPPV